MVKDGRDVASDTKDDAADLDDSGRSYLDLRLDEMVWNITMAFHRW